MRLSVAAEDRRRPAIPAKGGKNPVGSIFLMRLPGATQDITLLLFL